MVPGGGAKLPPAGAAGSRRSLGSGRAAGLLSRSWPDARQRLPHLLAPLRLSRQPWARSLTARGWRGQLGKSRLGRLVPGCSHSPCLPQTLVPLSGRARLRVYTHTHTHVSSAQPASRASAFPSSSPLRRFGSPWRLCAAPGKNPGVEGPRCPGPPQGPCTCWHPWDVQPGLGIPNFPGSGGGWGGPVRSVFHDGPGSQRGRLHSGAYAWVAVATNTLSAKAGRVSGHRYWESTLHVLYWPQLDAQRARARVRLCVSWGGGCCDRRRLGDQLPISHPRAFTFRPRRPTGPRYPSHRRARGGTGWPGGRLAYPHLRALREAPRPRPAAEPREGARQPARLRQNTRLSRNLETQGSRCHLRVTSSETPVIKCCFPAPSPGCGSPPCQGGKDKTWGEKSTLLRSPLALDVLTGLPGCVCAGRPPPLHPASPRIEALGYPHTSVSIRLGPNLGV